ncbi:MAG: MarR family transcriptional regulator [Anaerolineae bacterium]|nr:MarR family transcriptional regulator [Anaerolineae bacterium]MCB0200564.1 MarR family transcriptional regulator [Anaerolineae bacterium]MCB0204030.1 MarR family transcriptional regulator [Anaerolineae bacterium]MCB0253224.1 MarR family transcriptional regulator [Anaerolineae bacterium]
MTEQEVAETIGYLIVQLSKAHRNAAAEKLAPLGLYPGQEMLLCEISREDGLTQGELAVRLGVQPATVSKMLSRMDAAGLVSGCRDASDGRITRLHLTEEGEAVHDSIDEVWNDLERRTLVNFTLEERILLRRLLMQVIDNLGGQR